MVRRRKLDRPHVKLPKALTAPLPDEVLAAAAVRGRIACFSRAVTGEATTGSAGSLQAEPAKSDSASNIWKPDTNHPSRGAPGGCAIGAVSRECRQWRSASSRSDAISSPGANVSFRQLESSLDVSAAMCAAWTGMAKFHQNARSRQRVPQGETRPRLYLVGQVNWPAMRKASLSPLPRCVCPDTSACIICEGDFT